MTAGMQPLGRLIQTFRSATYPDVSNSFSRSHRPRVGGGDTGHG